MGVAAGDWARVMGEAELIAGFGVWEWDISSGRVQWSDALHGIYGLEPGEFAGTVEALCPTCMPTIVRGCGPTSRVRSMGSGRLRSRSESCGQTARSASCFPRAM